MRSKRLLVCLLLLICASVWVHAEGGSITLTWYGHALFTIAFDEGPTIMTDPFEPGLWGMTYPIAPMAGIDVVIASHEHEDHNYVQLATGDPVILRGVSETTGVRSIDETILKTRFYTVATCHSTQRPCSVADANAVFVIEAFGLRIAHLGDLGHVLTNEQVAQIGTIDILLIPVGGGPTIGASGANQVIATLKPRVIVGMHYETPELGWGIDTLEPFLEGKTVVEVSERSLIIRMDDLPAISTVYVLPYQ